MTNEALVKRIDDYLAMYESTLREIEKRGPFGGHQHAMNLLQQARDAIPVWRSVKTDGLPEPGQRVACLRSNGSWDRGEYACLGSECLGEWYMPEGPVPCARWSPEEKVITHWMPLPVPPAGEVSE